MDTFLVIFTMPIAKNTLLDYVHLNGEKYS